MAITPSPLRYPGGKSAIWPMVSKIITENNIGPCSYAEPYAGGCGLALSLLYRGFAHEIHINDIDVAIWSFWDSVLNRTEEIVSMIEETEVNVDQWKRQVEIHKNRESTSALELGFATFFLNRTNRSGVIKRAGVIGGLEQRGDYKIDCRYNKKTLIEKIRRIQKYKHRIHLYNMDAIHFINATKSILPKNTLYCVDPPYYVKGSSLYTDFYGHQDHVQLAAALKKLKKHWILTYDNSEEITKLYTGHRHFNFNLQYSVAVKRVGTELLIPSRGLLLPEELNIEEVA